MFKENVIFYIDAQNKLNEGIVLLKDSSRLEKLARKINAKAMLVKDEKSQKVLYDFARKLMAIAPEFRQLETDYKDAKPEERKAIKVRYKHLETKYIDFVKQINNETFINALKATGISVLSIAALLVMATLLAPVSVSTSSAGTETYNVPEWMGKILKPEDLEKLKREIGKMDRQWHSPTTVETKRFADNF